MKNILTIFLLLTCGVCFGQFSYPTLKSSGISITDFTPTGWTVLDSAFGDLNNDKLDDIVFVLQHRDSVTFIEHEDYNKPEYNDTIITQPRILVIVLYNTITKQYDLVEQSETFILNHDNPKMDDPYAGISIYDRVLKIDFHIWFSMGSWEMSNINYKFRYQEKQFKLIGADYNSVNRGSGETEDRSYNFVTKKVKVATGHISNDKKKTTWRTFDLKQLKTLKTFTQPFTWEVEEDFTL